MKVLIIEDSEYKLDYTKRILNEHKITDIVHFSKLEDAVMYLEEAEMDCNDEIKIDLILLDLCFYSGKDLHLYAGFSFLHYLEEYVKEIIASEDCVIIHSTENSYEAELHEYLYSVISERLYKSHKVYQNVSNLVSECEANISDLIFGHAHDESELDDLISKFIKAV